MQQSLHLEALSWQAIGPYLILDILLYVIVELYALYCFWGPMAHYYYYHALMCVVLLTFLLVLCRVGLLT